MNNLCTKENVSSGTFEYQGPMLAPDAILYIPCLYSITLTLGPQTTPTKRYAEYPKMEDRTEGTPLQPSHCSDTEICVR